MLLAENENITEALESAKEMLRVTLALDGTHYIVYDVSYTGASVPGGGGACRVCALRR